MNRVIPITGKFFLAALLTCPLYVWGRKAQRKKEKDKNELDKWLSNLRYQDKEKAGVFQAKMKSGRFILLLGAFCPLFWMALFSGQRGVMLLFHLCHSLLFVLVGFLMYRNARNSLFNMKAQNGKQAY